MNDTRRPAGAYDSALQGRRFALEDRRLRSDCQYHRHQSGPDSRTRFVRLIAFLQLFGLRRCCGKLALATKERDPLNRTKRGRLRASYLFVWGTASKLSTSTTVLKTEERERVSSGPRG